MLIALILLCAIAAAFIGSFVIPKRGTYNRLDKLGFIFNIILSVLYIPISLFGIFSLFAADSMFMYPETIQKIIELKQRRDIRTRLNRQNLGVFRIIGGDRRQPCRLHCTKNHSKFCSF